MSVVTPGDILARCRALGERVDIASRAISDAPAQVVDEAFRSAWSARLRRWAEVREMCGDWSSRWWNYKWGPILDDWGANQLEWERQIEARTQRSLPVPQQIKPDEDPTLPKFADLGSSGGFGMGVGLVAALGLVALGLSRARK